MNDQIDFFSFQGYKLILNRTKTTCTNDGNNLIKGIKSEGKPLKFSRCSTKCDQDENCVFVFINDASYCALYRSCENKRAAIYIGSTHEKVKGNILTKILY